MDSDLTHDAAIEMANGLVARGATVHFKFTCERCGARCTFSEPNTIYRNGECMDCGWATNDIPGYGLLVIFEKDPEPVSPDGMRGGE